MRRLTLLGLTLLGVWAAPAHGQGRIANIFNDYDLDAVAYVYCDPANIPALMGACATGVAATDGWIDVRGHTDKVLGIAIDTIGVVGGIDITIEVRYQKEGGVFTNAITLMNLINKTTAVTDNQSLRLPDEVTSFRVGMEIGTADDGADAIVEDIDIIYNGR
jgi:hypothetical protein